MDKLQTDACIWCNIVCLTHPILDDLVELVLYSDTVEVVSEDESDMSEDESDTSSLPSVGSRIPTSLLKHFTKSDTFLMRRGLVSFRPEI